MKQRMAKVIVETEQWVHGDSLYYYLYNLVCLKISKVNKI